MEDVFLSMRNISKRYAGVKALDSVDFSIRRGEIHCLAGTNGSGKSTLVKIISGVEQPDESSVIELEGVAARGLDSMQSIRRGIEVIYQDLSLFPNLTVAENIAMSEVVARHSVLVSWPAMRETAEKAMARIGISIPLDRTVGELSMADRQLVAICRALTGDVKLIIMDEPTTALTKKEVDALLAVVLDLKRKGIATLFISHKLNEVMQIAERVTVIRDGHTIGTFASDELDDRKIEFYMTGTNTVYHPYHMVPDSAAIPVLSLSKLSKADNFADIDLDVRAGEIVGITGLLGSGRTELALALFGLNLPDSGTIALNGTVVNLDSVRKAVANRIAYVPENRLVEGLVLEQSIARNIVMTVLDELLGPANLLEGQAMEQRAAHWVKELEIKIPSASSAVKTLSGGNQQRVVLAKWIATQPQLCILDNPTVGIDVAAKSSIHSIIKTLAGEGVAVIIISDEIAEVLYNCNRVVVMNRGRIIGSFESANSTEAQIQSFIESHAV